MIGNKDLYSRTPPYAEKHEAERKIQREKKECKRERKEKKLSIQERAKEHRERITRGESPSSRPVKQSATERGLKLVIRTIHVLKRPPLSLPPKTPHQA